MAAVCSSHNTMDTVINHPKIIIPGVPGQPNPPIISEIFKTSCVVTWTPPEENGGCPITGYVLERRVVGAKRYITLTKEPLNALTTEIKDLEEGMEYEFRVSAVNKIGTGEPSLPSKPFTAKDPWSKYIHHVRENNFI